MVVVIGTAAVRVVLVISTNLLCQALWGTDGLAALPGLSWGVDLAVIGGWLV